MSHFTVLVIGKNPKAQLAPYHEFECTGRDDEYVIDLDETEKYREEFTTDTTTRYKDEAGVLYHPWSDRFYRYPTPEEEKEIGPMAGTGFKAGLSWSSRDWGDGKGFRTKVKFIPEGFQELKCKQSDLMSFSEYCLNYHEIKAVPAGESPDLAEKHKYGYCLLDESGNVVKVVRRTNPNKKWDCYSLGGRWTGFFRLKEQAAGVRGRPGFMTPAAKEGCADSTLKGNIDFARMRSEAENAAAEKFDAIRAIIEPHLPVIRWKEILEKYCPNQGEAQIPGGIGAAREAYHSQPAVKALRDSERFRWEDAEDYSGDREKFIRHAGVCAHITFAVVKDGNWYERGKMGWWGMASDEKDDAVWAEEFAKLIDDLPDETLLTVYDCHI